MQAEEAIREAEKFDKIRADFTGTVQKIEVISTFLSPPMSLIARFPSQLKIAAQTTTIKAQGKKDAMATFQHVNGVMEDFEANKVAFSPTLTAAIYSHALLPSSFISKGPLHRSCWKRASQPLARPRAGLLVQQRHRASSSLQIASRSARRILSQDLPRDGLGGRVSHPRHVGCARNGAAHAICSALFCHP